MMDETVVYAFLDAAFEDIFGRKIELYPALAAKDVLGWDSFKQVEITLALEEQFNIRIRIKELTAVANVGDLVRLVQQKYEIAKT